MSSKTIEMTPELHEYLLQVSLREDEILRKLREATAARLPDKKPMQISPEQGQFMQLLLSLMNAQNAIEVGTFTGYSAICIARSLTRNSSLITLDASAEYTDIAAEFWKKAELEDVITLKLGDANKSLDLLLQENKGDYDFCFIDADKENYQNYFDKCLKLLRAGGLVAIDNTLWSGNVVKSHPESDETRAIQAFNQGLLHDERIDLSMVPIGDGLTLARKR